MKRRIRQMEADIKQFQPQLDQVAAFRKKKATLEKKIDVIDGLDRARSGPVRVLDELATHMPERVWLTKLETEGGAIKLKGESLDNELVAVLLRALGESPYFDKVDLQSTELGTKDGLKLVKFNVAEAGRDDGPGREGRQAASRRRSPRPRSPAATKSDRTGRGARRDRREDAWNSLRNSRASSSSSPSCRSRRASAS